MKEYECFCAGEVDLCVRTSRRPSSFGVVLCVCVRTMRPTHTNSPILTVQSHHQTSPTKMENRRQIPHNSYGVTHRGTHPTNTNNDDGWCAHTQPSPKRRTTVQIRVPAPAYTHIDKKFSVNQYFLHVIINGVSYKSAITTYGLACTIMCTLSLSTLCRRARRTWMTL
jgi:hypothetical protein